MSSRRHRKRATRRRATHRRRQQKQRGGGGSGAHGFEMPDGSVKYRLGGDYEGIEVVVDDDLFENGKFTPEMCDLEAESVDTFFNDESLYEKEDSAWRILKMQDGSIKGRRYGVKGMFTYTK